MVDFVNPGVLGSYAAFKKIYEEPIMRSRQPACSEDDRTLGEKRSEEVRDVTSLGRWVVGWIAGWLVGWATL